VFVNVTLSGAHPISGVAVKAGIGFGTTTICFDFVEIQLVTMFFEV